MPIRLGSSAVSLKLGTQSVTGYLGAQLVTATAPGAPTIVNASWDAGVGYTLIQYTAPESDGGSAITAHHLYVDGVEILPSSDFLESGEFYEYSDLTGSVVEVSVENEVGEGPKSASFAVT